MRKLLFYLLIVFTTTAHAAKPNWVVNYGHSEKHPRQIYIVGFGIANGSGEEATQTAKDNARADVSRQIVVNIQSIIRTAEAESKGVVSQEYSGITQSATTLQLQGLEVELYVEPNRSHPATYALAYVSRTELKRIYTERASKLREELRRILADAHTAEKEKKIAQAIEKYLSTYPLYEVLKETETILLVVRDSGSPSDKAFAELAAATRKFARSTEDVLPMSHTEVINRVEQLVSESVTSVDEIARAVVFQLSKQARALENKILLAPVTYQDTKMASQFSRQLLGALETQFGQFAKWETVTQARRLQKTFRPKSSQHTRDFVKDAGAGLHLSGTYWEESDKITLRITLRDVETGTVKAGAVVAFDQNRIAVSFKPQNYKQALIDQQAFTEEEFLNSGLTVETWTNRGDQNLLYTEGETMNVYVRVNRAAHIRLLYILADGRRTLLYDDYYIDQTKVNQIVEIPEEFECAEPFGAEFLVAAARTDPFPKIETYEADGYIFLAAQTAEKAVENTRGFKKKQKPPEVQYNEARLVITTMKE